MILLLTPFASAETWQPPACFEPQEVWEGRFTDDFPGDAYTRVELCRDGEHVFGTLLFDGVHGRDQRAVDGQARGDRLVMHDVQMQFDHPKPGWGPSCLCLRYDLRLTGGRLVGTCTTDPKTCGDHGHLDLQRTR